MTQFASLTVSYSPSWSTGKFGQVRPTLLEGPAIRSHHDPIWSWGPLEDRLDPAFLRAPSIPKAPPAAKLELLIVDGTPILRDGIAEKARLDLLRAPRPPLSEPDRISDSFAARLLRSGTKVVVAGFLAGLAVAWMLGAI